MRDENISAGYSYFKAGNLNEDSERSKRNAIRLSDERAEPSNRNPDKVLLQERRRHLEDWLNLLPNRPLDILDIGGRIQPYRRFLSNREGCYVAVDPQHEGLTDIVSTGESLPFVDSVFDFSICTQVLTYATDPERMIREIYRVLKPGGSLFLTVPSFFPEHFDERWRFLPDGIRKMLANWSTVDIRPEGNSAVGALRTISVVLKGNSTSRVNSFLSNRVLIPGINLISAKLVGRNSGNAMTANYSIWATK